MTYLSSGIQSTLQNAFYENNMALNIRSDFFVVEDSHASSREKIVNVIESAGFCSLISQNNIDRNFVFTVAPYKIPDFFTRTLSIDSLNLPLSEVKSSNAYLTKDEVVKLLEKKVFVKTETGKTKDKSAIVCDSKFLWKL